MIRRSRLLASAFVLCAVASAAGQTPPLKMPTEFYPARLSLEGRRAFEALVDVELFAVGGIGFGGMTSEGEKALRVLLEEKEAVGAFRSLLTRANPEGRLYALIGLRLKDRTLYRLALEAAKREPEPARDPPHGVEPILSLPPGRVRRMSECLTYTEERLKVLADIDSGLYDAAFDKHQKRALLRQTV